MKLISLNVGLFEKNNDRLIEFLAKEKPDVVCLQEVTKRLDERADDSFISKDSIDMATTGLSSNFFAPLWVLDSFTQKDFHGKELFDFRLGGFIEFGNYFKSKYRIVKAQNIFMQNHFSMVTDWSNWPQVDYRAVELVDIEVEKNQLIRFLNYHGIWSKDKRGNELTKKVCATIRDLALEVSYPSVICGDFNLFPDTESMKVFDSSFENLVNSYEIKTTRPPTNELSNQERNVVDYVLVSKGVRVKHFDVPNRDVSDHLPIIVDMTI